jgi:ATP-dependent RNA helicase SUPV3L1/SUV3
MVPLPVKSMPDSSNVGAELTGKLNKEEIMKWLAKFYQRREIKAAAVENGIDSMCLLCH